MQAEVKMLLKVAIIICMSVQFFFAHRSGSTTLRAEATSSLCDLACKK